MTMSLLRIGPASQLMSSAKGIPVDSDRRLTVLSFVPSKRPRERGAHGLPFSWG